MHNRDGDDICNDIGGTVVRALKVVPELLQSMPPGTSLYITVVEEAAKIDQMIFWLDQGRLYPENTN